MCLALDVTTWFCQTAKSSSLLPLGECRLPSTGLHLLLSFAGTWLRRTWRTPPSGWEQASAPLCAPCWGSLCTELFSNSGDGTAADGDSAPSLLTWKTKTLVDPSWPCPLFPYNTKKMLWKTILYALKQQCFGSFMWKAVDFKVSQLFFKCWHSFLLAQVGHWKSSADEIVIFLRSVIIHLDGRKGQRQPCRETPQRDLNLFCS